MSSDSVYEANDESMIFCEICQLQQLEHNSPSVRSKKSWSVFKP